MKDWDEEAYYEAEIRHLLARAHALCKARQIPMVALVQIASSDGGERHASLIMRPGRAGHLMTCLTDALLEVFDLGESTPAESKAVH